MRNIQKCLKEVKEELLQFLSDQEGYCNGNGTYIDATFSQNTYGGFTWNTPKAERTLTGHQKFELSYELNGKILKIMEKYGIETIEVKKSDEAVLSLIVPIELEVQMFEIRKK